MEGERRVLPESVVVLLAIVERQLQDERARGYSLETKTATIAGFTGAILALTAGFGRDLLDVELGTTADAVFRIFFVGAILSLAVGAVLAILGVLRPQERLAVSRAEMQRFSKLPMLSTPAVEIQGRMLSTLVDALEKEREVNDRKASLTGFAGIALVAGLLFVAAEAITVVVAA